MPKVKRINKIIHPNSRKALELASKEHHKARHARTVENTKNKTNVLIKKILWFKEEITVENQQEQMETETQVDEDQAFRQKKSYTMEDMHKLINLYFQRFDDEIEQIKLKNSVGKRNIGQHFSREKSIQMTLESEKNEYETSGLIVPDLTLIDNVNLIRSWKGERNRLQTIKFKTIKKEH
ncbi:translation machinery-associated 16-like protein [Brachionus plicatilis]|uniref:Translation machinery-associated 16-like protein n=1 Tax=Brachionus plicatilis TaxID=10195 RepID=A0A3M7SPP3_BRAPC|nr:translation machinery-associated 16-like protein [Brachionus plicatilis]